MIDLNAARAARREAKHEAPTVVFGDPEKTYNLPVEMPVEVFEHLAAAELAEKNKDVSSGFTAMLGIVNALLGDKQYKSFMDQRPSKEDLEVLFEGFMAEYGMAATEGANA